MVYDYDYYTLLLAPEYRYCFRRASYCHSGFEEDCPCRPHLNLLSSVKLTEEIHFLRKIALAHGSARAFSFHLRNT